MSVRTRFFIESLGGVVLGLVLYILVLAISNAHTFPIDVTNNSRFTLSEQTEKAVSELATPVKVYAFVDDKSKPKAQELLQRYQRLNPPKFSYELVNPKRQPVLTTEMDVHQVGVAVIEAEGTAGAPVESPKASDDDKDKDKDKDKAPKNHRERAATISEDDITNAILKLGRQHTVNVYALSGHGEREADGTDELGLGQFKASLGKEGFILKALNFAKDKTVPTDCKVLIIAGPKAPLLAKEEEMVRDFLKKDGRLFLMLEPDSPAQYVKLAADYGIDCPDQVILDPVAAQLGAEPVFSIGNEYAPNHPITKDFKQNTIFQLARPILVGKTLPPGAQVVAIAFTAKLAFTVPSADVLAQKTIKIEEGKYPPGVQSLAVAGTYPEQSATPSPTPAAPPTPGAPPAKKSPESRLVVVGDADFVSNSSFKLLGSRDFSLNIVNWLAETENQISIRSKEADGTPLRLTESELRNQSLFQCLIVPLAIGAMGLFLAWRRR